MSRRTQHNKRITQDNIKRAADHRGDGDPAKKQPELFPLYDDYKPHSDRKALGEQKFGEQPPKDAEDVITVPGGFQQFIRLLCRGAPKNMLALPDVNQTAVKRVIRDQGGNAQIFNFDDAITRQARLLSTEFLPLMGKLMDRLRLPFQSILMFYPIGAAFDNDDASHVCDLVYRASEGVLRVIPLTLYKEPNSQIMLSLPAYTYTITLEWRAHPITEHDIIMGTMTLAVMQRFAGRPIEQIVGYAEKLGHAEYGILGALVHYLGVSYQYASKGNDMEAIRVVANHFNFSPAPWGPKALTDKQQQAVGPLLAETNGHLRMVAALLLMLNLQDRVVTALPNRQRGNFRYRAHSHPYFTEHSVVLKIPEPKTMKALQDEAKLSTGIHHRRHPVLGHWCQKGGIDICPHEWEDIDLNHRNCILCSRKTWYRKDHERGDAALGYVKRKSYEVEKR